MEKQRLDKIIASTGRFSRREVKDLIRHGRVWVDGAPACSAQDQVDPETVAITINGEPMLYRRFTWVMLNKPAGCGWSRVRPSIRSRALRAAATAMSYGFWRTYPELLKKLARTIAQFKLTPDEAEQLTDSIGDILVLIRGHIGCNILYITIQYPAQIIHCLHGNILVVLQSVKRTVRHMMMLGKRIPVFL